MENTISKISEKAEQDYILEIRLKNELWQKIVEAALKREVSYSWIVRQSLFRLIKRKNPAFAGKLNQPGAVTVEGPESNNAILARTHEKSTPGMHRLKLCLCPEEKFFIRLAAIRARCSMSYLVRLSLQYYLDDM